MNEVFMPYLTREEVTAKAESGYAIVVPLAATEQHGPHLPVFTDSLICEYVVNGAVRKAAEKADVLVAPVLTIGCSQHHLSFGGTLSYTSETYLRVLHDIGESLVTDGFRKIIFINAHGGNEQLMIQTANDLAVKHPVWVASAAYWNVSRAAFDELNAAQLGMVPGHAGGFETAAVLALKPELVRTELMGTSHVQREWIGAGVPGAFIGRHGELTGYDGYTDAPHRATPEAGRLYLDVATQCVADWIVSTIQTMEKGST